MPPRFRWPAFEFIYPSIFSLVMLTVSAGAASSAEIIRYHGYDDCIELSNASTRVVLCPAAGGRVLEYSLGGKNALYLSPEKAGWTRQNGQRHVELSAGRFDIGPEKVVQRGQILWSGRWRAQIIGDRAARMTSQLDPKSGVRLVRDFELAEDSSMLKCTQTIENQSDQLVSLCHWSRTFAVGNGIAVVPRTRIKARERFPMGHVMYHKNHSIQFRTDDPNLHVTDEAVYVSGPPEFPKLGFDSWEGWLAYFAPNDLLFIKRFPTFPERQYNEIAGLTISVWYPDKPMVELEPIGPAENLDPGQKASFTETWELRKFKYPEQWSKISFEELRLIGQPLGPSR